MKGSTLVRINVQKDQASITCYLLIVKKHLGKEHLNLFLLKQNLVFLYACGLCS
jgi:hypothetical protein